MTPNQLHILQHSLGCDEYGMAERMYRDEGDGAMGYYRNRYVSDPDADLTALVDMSYIRDCGSMEICGSMHYYRVTKEGLAAMKAASPKPPKLLRSAQRYRDFLRADLGCSFTEYLKNGWYKPARHG